MYNIIQSHILQDHPPCQRIGNNLPLQRPKLLKPKIFFQKHFHYSVCFFIFQQDLHFTNHIEPLITSHDRISTNFNIFIGYIADFARGFIESRA